MALLTELYPTQKVAQFNKRGIYTEDDLAMYLPTKYKDYSQKLPLSPESKTCLVQAKVLQVKAYNTVGKVPAVVAKCKAMPTGENIDVRWFNQKWMYQKISNYTQRIVIIGGKVSYDEKYDWYAVTSPDIFEAVGYVKRSILPVYKKIPGMSAEYLENAITSALANPDTTSETMPKDIVDRYSLISRREALTNLHFPRTMTDVETGKERVIFDDLVYFNLKTVWAERNSAIGSPYQIKTRRLYNQIAESLPYELTNDQKAAIENMIGTASQGKRINALLQGDVGCGKSIVAFIMMALMADSGYQSAIMAPTQVLARQHYEDLVNLMEPLGYKIAFLGTGMKKAERLVALEGIKTGETAIVVGTHAIISNDVEYNRLGLTVADEEHRFGVLQREALVKKAAGGAHSITMSATPIPRSLAQTIYGDTIQLLTIQTMPVNRKPVVTGVMRDRARTVRFIAKEAKLGHQTYIVCPMIDKNDDIEGVKSVEEISKEYGDALRPYGVEVATLTGRTKKADTEEILERFKTCEVPVLISTTVVEVGVNVPTATTMVVTNAERFGLSTLHQLRGRVGRGDDQAYCVLESADAGSDTKAGQRLNILCTERDGFKIAEADLAMRGAGDFIGLAQSGDNYYVELMLAHPDIYRKAREAAKILLDRGDPCQMVQNVMRGKDEESKNE